MRRLAAALVVVCAGAAVAHGAEPEPTLGPWARAGRPLVVRAPGATRVRGGGSPWATPQGADGDEFVLQSPRADVLLREVEVDRGGAVERVALPLRALPTAGPLTAVFTATTTSPGAVSVPVRGLPTIREAWLLVDDVAAAPPGASPAALRAIGAWRDGPRSGPRAAFEPLLHAPGPEAFRAAAEAAARAPRLPPGTARLLWVLAAIEAALLVLLRAAPPRRRVAWLVAPPVACVAWLAATGALPGRVRATWTAWAGTDDVLVVLRLEAPRGGDVAFRVPDAATTPALLRFDADDRSGADADVGRAVRMSLAPRESRLLAWRISASPGAGAAAGPDPGDASAAWLRTLGLAADGAGPDVPVSAVLDSWTGFAPVRASSARVR